MAFTLSQAGMVMHWKRQGGAPFRMFINGLGALATGITTLVVLVAKFVEGAWITALLVVVMILCDARGESALSCAWIAKSIWTGPLFAAEVTEPDCGGADRPLEPHQEKALSFALSMSTDIRCVHVQTSDEPDPFCAAVGGEDCGPLRTAGKCVPKLVTLKSPYRYVLYPLVDYVLGVEKETDYHKVCVLVPELVVRHWWEGLLHNRRADLAEGDPAAARQPAHHCHQYSVVSGAELSRTGNPRPLPFSGFCRLAGFPSPPQAVKIESGSSHNPSAQELRTKFVCDEDAPRSVELSSAVCGNVRDRAA